MKSIVTISRTTEADLTLEHPDEWGEEQIKAAVANRALDIMGCVPFWRGENRTLVVSVTLDDEAEMPSDWCGPMPEPLTLTDDDL